MTVQVLQDIGLGCRQLPSRTTAGSPTHVEDNPLWSWNRFKPHLPLLDWFGDKETGDWTACNGKEAEALEDADFLLVWKWVAAAW